MNLPSPPGNPDLPIRKAGCILNIVQIFTRTIVPRTATHERETMAHTAPPPSERNTLLQSFSMLFRPYETQQKMRQRHGNIYTVRTFFETLVFVSTPEAARTVFSANAEEYYEPYGATVLGPFLGQRSVFMLSGQQHRRERAIIMPPFARSRMSRYTDLIIESAREQAESWKSGETVVMMDEHLKTTLTIILRAVFGVHDGARMDVYRDRIAEAVDSVKPAVMFFEFLQRDFGGIGPWADFQRHRREMDGLLFEEIDRRRKEGVEGDDILSVLVQSTYEDGSPLDNDAIRDHLVSLLVAGHETTSIALSNAFYRLHRNPGTLARLRCELDELGPNPAPDELIKLPYLEAVCNETLRLIPIVPAVARILKKPMTLEGHELPAGTKIAVAIGGIHHDPEIYPEPYSFKPERFLERRYNAFEFMPFGGGHRRCVGATLAMHEMKLVLAELLQNWNFELLEDEGLRFIRRNVTMAPQTGVRMRVLGRRH